MFILLSSLAMCSQIVPEICFKNCSIVSTWLADAAQLVLDRLHMNAYTKYQ